MPDQRTAMRFGKERLKEVCQSRNIVVIAVTAESGGPVIIFSLRSMIKFALMTAICTGSLI
jgi:hypothetical protein